MYSGFQVGHQVQCCLQGCRYHHRRLSYAASAAGYSTIAIGSSDHISPETMDQAEEVFYLAPKILPLHSDRQERSFRIRSLHPLRPLQCRFSTRRQPDYSELSPRYRHSACSFRGEFAQGQAEVHLKSESLPNSTLAAVLNHCINISELNATAKTVSFKVILYY